MPPDSQPGTPQSPSLQPAAVTVSKTVIAINELPVDDTEANNVRLTHLWQTLCQAFDNLGPTRTPQPGFEATSTEPRLRFVLFCIKEIEASALRRVAEQAYAGFVPSAAYKTIARGFKTSPHIIRFYFGEDLVSETVRKALRKAVASFPSTTLLDVLTAWLHVVIDANNSHLLITRKSKNNLTFRKAFQALWQVSPTTAPPHSARLSPISS